MNIRPFNGTVRDAEGLIAVDRETFGDCHYPSSYILELVATSRQHVWVAEEGEKVVGFVSAFATYSLSADHWEVDELAVHPSAQGRGIGSALVAHALANAPLLSEARSLIALANVPSQRAFARNGWAPVAQVHLLSCPIPGSGRARLSDLLATRPAAQADAPVLAELSGCPARRATDVLDKPDNLYLVAERKGIVLGYIELIHVHTLQYEGFWLESLAAVGADRRVVQELLSAALQEAHRLQTVDQIGYLASPEQKAMVETCMELGFKRRGEYQVFARKLN